MKIKSFNEVKKMSGYIGIRTQIKNITENKKIFSDIFFTELARVSKALYLNNDNIPCHQILHLGGAFLSGEQYLTDIIIENDAHLILTSQSATKVNRTKPEDDSTSYTVNVELQKNSKLEFINDSIILYPQARYRQINNFYLHESSTLIYWEIISPGYYGHSDVMHQYDEMWMTTNLFINNKLILFDNLYYNPRKQNINDDGIMNNYERTAIFLFASPLITNNSTNEINDLIKLENFNFSFEYAISEFYPKAIGIRLLANQTYELEKIFNLIHKFIRNKYLNLESLNLRKQYF